MWDMHIRYYVARKTPRSRYDSFPQVCFTHAVQLAAAGVHVEQEVLSENPGTTCCMCYDNPVTHVSDLNTVDRDLRTDP